jgi:Leucine-rich repeat (LRR) protein
LHHAFTLELGCGMKSDDDTTGSAARRPLTVALTHATSDMKGIATLALTIATIPTAFVALRDALHLDPPGPQIGCIIPIAVFFAFYLVPEWRTARDRKVLEEYGIQGEPPPPGYFRLTPHGLDERAKFHRPDGAEDRALKWIQQSQDQVLYLAGLSGVGKSSLLGAYVFPALKDSGWTVVEARPYDDPLRAIANALTRPSAIWKQPPAGNLTVRETLERAAAAVARSDKRLLLALDQFEEVLILLDEDQRRPFAAFLRELHERPIQNLTILLSIRLDYIGALEALPLPPPTYGANWFEVKRFTPPAARRFIERSDLKPGPKLVEQVLKEAAEIEGSPDQVRPVVINMYGLVLSSFKGHLPGDLAKGRLLSAYVQRSLDRSELKEVSRAVIAPLVTDVGTKRARSLEEIATKASISIARARGALLRLAEDGLVRAVDKAGTHWEVAHDFVARLLLPLLEAGSGGRWNRARSWMTAGAMVMWAALIAAGALMYPKWHQAHLREQLSNAGLVFASSSSATETAFRFNDRDDADRRLAGALPLLREVKPPVTTLLSGRGFPEHVLARIPPLPTTLVQLGLGGSAGLTSLEGMPDLPALDHLILSLAPRLTSLAGMPSYPALTRLDIFENRLASLHGIPALPQLKQLNLSMASDLTSLAGMPRFPHLERLDLSRAKTLNSLAGMPALPELATLNLSDARMLTSLAGMPALPELAWLKLSDSPKLASLAEMPMLPKLETLILAKTERLASLAGMPRLPALKRIDLNVNGLTSLAGMPSFPALEELDLWGSSLASMSGMPSLPRLSYLKLSKADGQISLAGTPILPALTSLELTSPDATTLRDALGNLPALRSLRLLGNAAFFPELPNSIPLRKLNVFQLKLDSPLDLRNLATQASTVEQLDLGSVAVLDYAPLAQLSNLIYLDLNGAKIRDLSCLTSLSSLEVLDLRHVYGIDLAPLEQLSSLRAIIMSAGAEARLKIPAGLRARIEWK